MLRTMRRLQFSQGHMCHQIIAQSSRRIQRSFQSSVPADKGPDVRLLGIAPQLDLRGTNEPMLTSVKLELIRRLVNTGLEAIDASPFVNMWSAHPGDRHEMMEGVVAMQVERPFRFPVPMRKADGVERIVDIGVSEGVVSVPATAPEDHGRGTRDRTVNETMHNAKETVTACLARGVHVRGEIHCTFASRLGEPTEPSKVLSLARRLLDMGCHEVQLCDLQAAGTLVKTEELLRLLLSELPAHRLACRFHNSNGQGIATVLKAYEMGLRAFAGVITGSKGNRGMLLEDIVNALESAAVHTGVDVAQLADVGDWTSKRCNTKTSNRTGAAAAVSSISKCVAMKTQADHREKAIPQIEWQTISGDGEHRVARSGNMVKITLTRPQNGNALTNSMIESITNLFNELADDPTVFQILLEAEGQFFCTGMDLSASGSSSSSDPAAKAEYYTKVEAFFDAVQNSPKITIAVIDQPCFGGGVGLAFCCDVRLCSRKASFTLTEITLGLSPAVISRQVIREWGIPFAREAMLSGRTVTPHELKKIGSVHGLVRSSEMLQKMVEGYVRKLKHSAPQSASAIKQLVRLAWKDPGGEEQDQLIAKTFEKMMVPGSEGEHGMAQFRKKNKKIDWCEFWASSADKPQL